MPVCSPSLPWPPSLPTPLPHSSPHTPGASQTAPSQTASPQTPLPNPSSALSPSPSPHMPPVVPPLPSHSSPRNTASPDVPHWLDTDYSTPSCPLQYPAARPRPNLPPPHSSTIPHTLPSRIPWSPLS